MFAGEEPLDNGSGRIYRACPAAAPYAAAKGRANVIPVVHTPEPAAWPGCKRRRAVGRLRAVDYGDNRDLFKAPSAINGVRSPRHSATGELSNALRRLRDVLKQRLRVDRLGKVFVESCLQALRPIPLLSPSRDRDQLEVRAR